MRPFLLILSRLLLGCDEREKSELAAASAVRLHDIEETRREIEGELINVLRWCLAEGKYDVVKQFSRLSNLQSVYPLFYRDLCNAQSIVAMQPGYELCRYCQWAKTLDDRHEYCESVLNGESGLLCDL